MKLFSGLILLAILAIGTTSCGKDKLEKSIVGTWEGHWGFDSDVPSNFERWAIKKNGELIAYTSSGAELGVGTWDLDGFNFSCEYFVKSSNSTYLFKGLYSDAAGEITGTWGEKPSHADGGTFVMNK